MRANCKEIQLKLNQQLNKQTTKAKMKYKKNEKSRSWLAVLIVQKKFKVHAKL